MPIDRARNGLASLNTLQDVLAGFETWSTEPAVIAFRDGTRETVTYGELENLARRLASGLVVRGISIGDPVGIYADNRPGAIALRLALIAVGAMMVSVDQDLTPKQLANIDKDGNWLGPQRTPAFRSPLDRG